MEEIYGVNILAHTKSFLQKFTHRLGGHQSQEKRVHMRYLARRCLQMVNYQGLVNQLHVKNVIAKVTIAGHARVLLGDHKLQVLGDHNLQVLGDQRHQVSGDQRQQVLVCQKGPEEVKLEHPVQQKDLRLKLVYFVMTLCYLLVQKFG